MTQQMPLVEITAGKLNVRIYPTRAEMGAEAAKAAAQKIRELLATRKGLVSIIFAAAPSQNEFLSCLSKEEDIEWSRVNAFHMDEYVGIDQTAPQSFAFFLKEKLFDKVPLHAVYSINGCAGDLAAECERYTTLLREYPPDIVCMGIGENTHIAFNDPHTADFNDPLFVKLVTLDEVSRQQQVNDGCFPDLSSVPTTAITLTVPALLQAPSIYCMVPGKTKASAVYQTLNSNVSEKVPSTILKEHSGAYLFLDQDSAGKLSL
ncbi:MAG TPA: glucosamine-6-phosphate deaminase [Flavisolibacter sp.]|jgi:glucosamine-6-phosphate deaminase|nr:glucosamine-6-phosphate deaminase [Flavisolibacter sp.]